MHTDKYETFKINNIREYDEKMKQYYEERPIRAPFTLRNVKG